MKIAQIAPLYESVPPKLYGGTERVVSNLTEALVELGHDITLFASGDSVTAARLLPACPSSLRLDKGCIDQLAHHFVMLDEVMERADEFDIIHFHIDYLHFPLSKLTGWPHVTTLHGRLDLPDLAPLYRKYAEMPVVSISRAQRKPLPWANWVGNVYHGLSATLSQGDGSGKYLAFLGRICPEKGVDRAIKIAVEAGMPLKIAAKVDRVDREYYEMKIKPLLAAHSNVEYIGEITEQQKCAFLGNAYAHLFPIDWPEPFGLTMIEAMACGTPTIALNRGSVPEVLKHGVSGFIVDNIPDAVKAVAQAGTLSRASCRQEFEARFTSSRMARDYVKLYEAMLSTRSVPAEMPETDSMLTL
jgi:glycosyltransferase involved in cell wall biosynthesis